MQKMKGIAMTDGLNRKDHFIPFESMMKAYEEAWERGGPTNLNHDSTKFAGWTYLSGIYLEPGKAYLTNEVYIPENDEEHKQLVEKNIRYLEQIYYYSKIDEFNRLRDMLGEYLSNSAMPALVNCVAFEDKNIVLKVFPELEADIHKGLIDLKLLEPVLPGIYKRGQYILFAHRYFRRSYSLLNALNDSFLERFDKLRNSDLKVQIALDLDMIGLSGTEQMEVEYQYWWGPKFDEDLSKIPVGVTRHKNEHYDNLFSNIDFTEFGWYVQDGRQTFECEEVNVRPNIWNEEEFFGCRFVHSMLNPDSNLPNHLDGAVRAYTDEKMLIRLDSNIAESERDTWYTKLWRIDNDMPVSLWKELITHYYRDNMLIGEYFGGNDKKLDKIVIEKEDVNKETPLEKYIPANLEVASGLRFYCSYLPNFTMNSYYDVTIQSSTYLYEGESKTKIIENETITVLKLLSRYGLKVRIPITSRIAHEDTVFNFPTFVCKNVSVVKMLQYAMYELCNAWNKEGDNRLISYSFRVNYDSKAILFSIAGHVSDFCNVFSQFGTDFPENEGFIDWISMLYKVNNKFKEANNYPKPADMITENGTLKFRRFWVPSKYLKDYKMEDHCMVVRFLEKKDIVQELIDNKIGIAPVYQVKYSSCMKCNKSYLECSCVKFIDDIGERMDDVKFKGATWTNRHA